ALDEKLLRALTDPKCQALARSFDAKGLADFRAHSDWRRDAAGGEAGHFENRYLITFHDATVVYDRFPFRLERGSGVIDIRPDHWEFRDFRGAHGGCTFTTSGRSRRGAGGQADHVEVAIAGRGVRLDDDLRQALLKEEMQHAWATFRPEGLIDFDGT